MNEITKNIMDLISERKSSNEICESLQITHHELYKRLVHLKTLVSIIKESIMRMEPSSINPFRK